LLTGFALRYWITSLTTSLFASHIGSAIALPYTFIVVLMSAWRIGSFCTVIRRLRLVEPGTISVPQRVPADLAETWASPKNQNALQPLDGYTMGRG